MFRRLKIILVVFASSFLLFAIFLLPQELAAEDFSLFPFAPQLSKHVQDYHKQPKPKEALNHFFDIDIEQFEKKAEEADQPHSRAILMAFYINILVENSELVLPFANRLINNSTGAQAALGTEILAHGATSNRKEALALIVKRYKLGQESTATIESLDVLPYPYMTATDWQALDILWACFFATGKDLYIEKIAEPLIYWQVPDEKFGERLRNFERINPAPGTEQYEEWFGAITAQASMMSLTVNASKDPAIYKSLVEISKKRQDRVGELTKKITDVISENGSKN